MAIDEPDEASEVPSYVRKETGWITNCKELADLLQGECENKYTGQVWHRHVSLENGRARKAQVYPPNLVYAILKTLKKTLVDSGRLSALEERVAGPVPEEPLVAYDLLTDPNGNGEDWSTYYDDVNGGWLETGMVKKARVEGLKWVKDQSVILKCGLKSATRKLAKHQLHLNG